MTTFELTRAFLYPAEQVYAKLTDMESYPQYMKNIDHVTVLARDAKRTQTRWEATLDGKKIVWTEDDVFDASAHTISYCLVEGDMDEMQGTWQVKRTESGATVSLRVSFSFANPMLTLLVEPILKRKLEENSQMLLDGIEAQLASK